MNKQFIISTIVALGILSLGVLGFKLLSTKKEKKKTPITKTISKIYVDKVLNTHKSIQLVSTGLLQSRNKIDLFSEVQGVFQNSKHMFKPGEKYFKGDVLLNINSNEFRANLQVQKSNFYQKLISILPDMKLDYPDQFTKWENYVATFEMDNSVQQLPKFETEQEKLYITGKGVLSTYYAVKNLQERQVKYVIRAPFTGVLSDVNVNIGELISPGQKLGSFINPNIYELELTVDSKTANIVKIGSEIELQSMDKQNSWQGKVIRINPVVDSKTQSASFFVEVSGENLNDGMYLEAVLESENKNLVYEINRSLINQDNTVYILMQDSVLQSTPIEIYHLTNKTALISGLQDGDLILAQPLPGAFDGKIVEVIKE